MAIDLNIRGELGQAGVGIGRQAAVNSFCKLVIAVHHDPPSGSPAALYGGEKALHWMGMIPRSSSRTPSFDAAAGITNRRLIVRSSGVWTLRS